MSSSKPKAFNPSKNIKSSIGITISKVVSEKPEKKKRSKELKASDLASHPKFSKFKSREVK